MFAHLGFLFIVFSRLSLFYISPLKNIIDRIDEMTVDWDDETATPVAHFPDGSGIVSYDDERSICLKTEYAIDESLNGFVSPPPPSDLRPCPAVACYLRARARMRSSWR